MEEIQTLKINTEDTDEDKKDDTDTVKDTIDKFDAFKLFSNYNENGIPYNFIRIKERLMQEGYYEGVLSELWSYHQEYTPNFDAFTNFMISCGYFSDKELGNPSCKKEKLKLVKKVKILMRKRSKNEHQNIYSFLKENPL